jgi:hypothetical protein
MPTHFGQNPPPQSAAAPAEEIQREFLNGSAAHRGRATAVAALVAAIVSGPA